MGNPWRRILPGLLALALPAQAAVLFLEKPFTLNRGKEGERKLLWINSRHWDQAGLKALALQLYEAGRRDAFDQAMVILKAKDHGYPPAQAEAAPRPAGEGNPQVGVDARGRPILLGDLKPGGSWASAAFQAGVSLQDQDLTGSDFSRADLEGVDLSGCRLDGCCFAWSNLWRATLPKGFADLPGIILHGALGPSGERLDLPDMDVLGNPFDGHVQTLTQTPESLAALCALGPTGEVVVALPWGMKEAHEPMAKALEAEGQAVAELPLDGLDLGVPLHMAALENGLAVLMEDRRSVVYITPRTFQVIVFQEDVADLGPVGAGFWASLPGSRRVVDLEPTFHERILRIKHRVRSFPAGLPRERGLVVALVDGSIVALDAAGKVMQLAGPGDGGEAVELIALEEPMVVLEPCAGGGLGRDVLGLTPTRLYKLPCMKDQPYAHGQAACARVRAAQGRDGETLVARDGALQHLVWSPASRSMVFKPVVCEELKDSPVSALRTGPDGRVWFATRARAGLGVARDGRAAFFPLDVDSAPVQVEADAKRLYVRLDGRASILLVDPARLIAEAKVPKARPAAAEDRKIQVETPEPRSGAPETIPETIAETKAQAPPEKPAPLALDARHILRGHAWGLDNHKGQFLEGAGRKEIQELVEQVVARPSVVQATFRGRTLYGARLKGPVGWVWESAKEAWRKTDCLLVVLEVASRRVITAYPVRSLPCYALR